jgi:hypothetical protein
MWRGSMFRFFSNLGLDLLIGLTISLYGTPAKAQTIWNGYDVQFWDGGNLVNLRQQGNEISSVVRNDGSIALESKKPASKDRADSLGNFDYFEGAFYFFSRERLIKRDDGTFHGEFRLLRLCEKGWEVLGTGDLPGSCDRMVRLENGKYLGVCANGTAFQIDKKLYPFGILQIEDSGKISVVDGMDLGLSESFLDNAGRIRYGALMLPLISGQFVRVDHYLVFPSPYGVFWIFDARNGHLNKVARLYPSITDEDLKGRESFPMLPGLHGLAGTPDGKVILSVRNEDAVRFGIVGGYPAGVADPESLRQWADQVDKRYPLVEWWILDPERGSFEREIPPFGVPDRLESQEAVANFKWRYDFNGHIGLARSTKAEPKESGAKGTMDRKTPTSSAHAISGPSLPAQTPAADDAPV